MLQLEIRNPVLFFYLFSRDRTMTDTFEIVHQLSTKSLFEKEMSQGLKQKFDVNHLISVYANLLPIV